jgi:hypothetical protein
MEKEVIITPVKRINDQVKLRIRFIYNMLADGIRPGFIADALRISDTYLYDYLTTGFMIGMFDSQDYTKLRQNALTCKIRLLKLLKYKGTEATKILNLSKATYWRLAKEIPCQMNCWMLFKTQSFSPLAYVNSWLFVRVKDWDSNLLEIRNDKDKKHQTISIEDFRKMKPVMLDPYPYYSFIIKTPDNPFVNLKTNKEN